MQDNALFNIHETSESITITFSSTMDNIDRTCEETNRFLMELFKRFDSFKCDNFKSGNKSAKDDCQQTTEYSEKFRSHLFAIQLVMREGLTNAVRHGNCLNPSKTVRCSVDMKADLMLHMEIEDQGKGFNWKKEQQCRDMDETADHGRGLMIMEQYFSRYWYNESGNKLLLEKSISLG